MKLSSKGRYAVRALFDMAYFGAGSPIQVRDIAARQGIPARFLEQIFQDLKRAKLVAAKRGPQGGYRLAAAPADVTLGDVIRAVEGPLELADPEARSPASLSQEGRDSARVTGTVLDEVARSVDACLNSISVEDLCDRAERLRVRRPGSGPPSYVI